MHSAPFSITFTTDNAFIDKLRVVIRIKIEFDVSLRRPLSAVILDIHAIFYHLVSQTRGKPSHSVQWEEEEEERIVISAPVLASQSSRLHRANLSIPACRLLPSEGERELGKCCGEGGGGWGGVGKEGEGDFTIDSTTPPPCPIYYQYPCLKCVFGKYRSIGNKINKWNIYYKCITGL